MTIATVNEDEDFDGLEDFGSTDFRTPRLRIGHKDEDALKFINTLSGERYDSIDVVVLALVRGRIMWKEELEEDSSPQCKSLNFDMGRPNLDAKNEEDLFPWDESNFDESHMTETPDGVKLLPCSACKFKDWERKGKRNKPPRCNEQHNYVLQLVETGETFILTLQRSGLKPSIAFASGFKQKGISVFEKITRITLQQAMKGSNTYSVPKFQIIADSDIDYHDQYAMQGREIRKILRNGMRQEEDAAVDVVQENTPPPVAQPAAKAAPQRVARPTASPAPAAEPIVDAVVIANKEELPF